MEYKELKFTTRAKLINDINDSMYYAIRECLDSKSENAFERFKVGSSFIEIDVQRWSDDADVIVCHDGEHESPLLESYIKSNLNLDWDVISMELEEENRTEDSFRSYIMFESRKW